MLLHDNALPHTGAAHTTETLQKLAFEVMAHPPYNPDLAPYDYHLFGHRGIKGPSILFGARSEGSGACVVRCSAENLLFGGHQEACARMYQAH